MKVSVVKAAAYAVVGYQTAYLMHYYPVETIAAMLNSMMGSSEKVAHYINFAESLGIQVLPPNINESYSKFTVKGDKIRFGLAAIKNVGINVVDSIVEARNSKGKFESITDFINKIDLSAINKRAVESLIKAGALDEFTFSKGSTVSQIIFTASSSFMLTLPLITTRASVAIKFLTLSKVLGKTITSITALKSSILIKAII